MKQTNHLNLRKIGIGPMSPEVIEAVYKYSSINNTKSSKICGEYRCFTLRD